MEEIAREKGCTAAQLALAWVLAQGQDIVPIPGTRHPQYVEENLQATNVHLSPDDLERLNKAVPPGIAAGERYPAQGMQAVNR